MKGNDGRAARRKRIRQGLILGSSLLGLVAVMVVARKIFVAQNPSLNYPYGYYGSSSSGAAAAGGAADSARQFRFSLHRQFSGSDKEDEAQVLQDVLAAKLQLIDLMVVEEELLRAPPNSYAGVYGKFCNIDWTLRKRDPSAGTSVVALRCFTVAVTSD